MPTAPSRDTPKSNNFIGANISAARTTADMTQLALAHVIGWKGENAGAQISRIESGKNLPRVTTLQQIALALGVTLESLLTPPKLTPYAEKLLSKKG